MNITVIGSEELHQLKLDDLIGKQGKVVEEHRNGCWVNFNVKYLGEQEWFIPFSSIKKQ